MKKKHVEILDIPAIQKEVREKHQLFINTYGSTIDQVMANHKLFTDIVIAKLQRILLTFKEEAIIDDVKIEDHGPCKRVIISKNGFDTYVQIETNGAAIIFQGYTYTVGFDSNFRHGKEIINGANEENFNWTLFSSRLIDYIHGTIYGRKEVIEKRISGLMSISDLGN